MVSSSVRLIEVFKGNQDSVKELINDIGLLFGPVCAIKITDRVSELLVVDLSHAVLRREFPKTLEVAFNRDSDAPRRPYDIVHTRHVNLLEERLCLVETRRVSSVEGDVT